MPAAQHRPFPRKIVFVVIASALALVIAVVVARYVWPDGDRKPDVPEETESYLESISTKVHQDNDICFEPNRTPIPVLSMKDELLVSAVSRDAASTVLTAFLSGRPFDIADGSAAAGLFRVIVPNLDPNRNFMTLMQKSNRDPESNGTLISLNFVYSESQVYRFHPFSPPVQIKSAPNPEPVGGAGRTIAVFDSRYPKVPLAAAVGVPSPADSELMPYPALAPTRPYPAIGHGPFVASLIQRYASSATVEPYGIAEIDPGGALINIGDVQRAMSKAFQETRVPKEPDFAGPAPDIINLSLGGAGCDLAEPAVFGEFLNRVATVAEWSHSPIAPVIVAAAGNSSGNIKEYPAAFSGADTNIYPALAAHVAAVGSLSPGQTVPDCFSNVGKWVNIWAPGKDQIGYYPYGTHWATWSGTSFATARVSAMLADLATNGKSAEAAWAEVAGGSTAVPDMPITQITTEGTC